MKGTQGTQGTTHFYIKPLRLIPSRGTNVKTLVRWVPWVPPRNVHKQSVTKRAFFQKAKKVPNVLKKRQKKQKKR